MSADLNLPLIMLAHFVAVASPGPGIMAIAGASLNHGRPSGLAIAFGMSTASLLWGTAAALGLGTLLSSSQAFWEVFRYLGSGYLLYLALRSARAMIARQEAEHEGRAGRAAGSFWRGLMIQLTNPKAVLFFAALYAVGMPAHPSASDLIVVVLILTTQSVLILHGYALLLSVPTVTKAYRAARRYFEAAFAAVFGYAALRVLFAKGI
jgi:threonine/homoserine/homoserine lactone efflux protein